MVLTVLRCEVWTISLGTALSYSRPHAARVFLMGRTMPRRSALKPVGKEGMAYTVGIVLNTAFDTVFRYRNTVSGVTTVLICSSTLRPIAWLCVPDVVGHLMQFSFP